MMGVAMITVLLLLALITSAFWVGSSFISDMPWRAGWRDYLVDIGMWLVLAGAIYFLIYLRADIVMLGQLIVPVKVVRLNSNYTSASKWHLIVSEAISSFTNMPHYTAGCKFAAHHRAKPNKLAPMSTWVETADVGDIHAEDLCRKCWNYKVE